MGMCVAAVAEPSNDDPSSSRPQKIMKYAFNTWTYSSFPAWLPSYPLDEAIRRIAAIGYDGVEIGCAAPHAWPAYLNKERRAELRSLLRDCGLQAVSLLATPAGGPGFNPASPLTEEREATVRYYNETSARIADT
jgi:fructoselysine 3-epimerase